MAIHRIPPWRGEEHKGKTQQLIFILTSELVGRFHTNLVDIILRVWCPKVVNVSKPLPPLGEGCGKSRPKRGKGIILYM